MLHTNNKRIKKISKHDKNRLELNLWHILLNTFGFTRLNCSALTNKARESGSYWMCTYFIHRHWHINAANYSFYPFSLNFSTTPRSSNKPIKLNNTHLLLNFTSYTNPTFSSICIKITTSTPHPELLWLFSLSYVFQVVQFASPSYLGHSKPEQ